LEKFLSVQLSDFFDNIFDHFLCAFRKGHGCQTTLLKLLEDWKQAKIWRMKRKGVVVCIVV
jgi:isocitrate dehydrogenase kinase/phosphatase